MLAQLVDLLSNRVPPGVDEAAYPKAAYLSALALGTESPTLISRPRSIELLGTMQGGYNVSSVSFYFAHFCRWDVYHLVCATGDDHCIVTSGLSALTRHLVVVVRLGRCFAEWLKKRQQQRI